MPLLAHAKHSRLGHCRTPILLVFAFSSTPFIRHRRREHLKLRVMSPLVLIPTEGRQAQVLPAQYDKQQSTPTGVLCFFWHVAPKKISLVKLIYIIVIRVIIFTLRTVFIAIIRNTFYFFIYLICFAAIKNIAHIITTSSISCPDLLP